jgi:Holliday junction resolvase RusA-like endonuclease
VKTYTDAKTAAYEAAAAFEYRKAAKGFKFSKNTPIGVIIYAFYPIAKSTSKTMRAKMLDGTVHPMKKPDLDNVSKAVLDALNGVAYHDDAQVITLKVKKMHGEQPRVVVSVFDLSKIEEGENNER